MHYLQSFWNVNFLAGTEAHAQAKATYQTARDNLFFFASDDALKRISDFHQYIVHNPTDKDQEEVEKLLAAALLAMRKDFSPDTTLTLEEIKSRLTIEV